MECPSCRADIREASRFCDARPAGARSASRTESARCDESFWPAAPARQAVRQRCTEPCDDLRSPHSMTSSARNRMEGNKTTPIFWAVRAFTANSKRVGPSMGRSPGAAPFKIRTT